MAAPKPPSTPSGETLALLAALIGMTGCTSATQPQPESPPAPGLRAATEVQAEVQATQVQAEPGPFTPTGAELNPRARECLARDDNACIIRALDGRAVTESEHTILVETHRVMGNIPRMLSSMELYVRRFPTGPRASDYRQFLAQQGR